MVLLREQENIGREAGLVDLNTIPFGNKLFRVKERITHFLEPGQF